MSQVIAHGTRRPKSTLRSTTLQMFRVSLRATCGLRILNTRRSGTACRECTGEAWTEVKTVNAVRAMRLERKCIFVGIK